MNNKTITLTQTPLKQRKEYPQRSYNRTSGDLQHHRKDCPDAIFGFHVLPSERICLCNGRIYQSQTKVEFSGNLNRNGISVCCKSRQECRRPHVLQQKTKRSFGSNF